MKLATALDIRQGEIGRYVGAIEQGKAPLGRFYREMITGSLW